MSCLNPQALFDELFPLCRSLTGLGYEKSLAILQRYIPFEVEEYPCGSQVFDWTVPQHWTLNRATLKDGQGNIILDTDVNPLHVVNYSEPFKGEVTLEELQKHLYSDPNNPTAIPYVISYYNKRWGFCLSHNQREQLSSERYTVEIDTVKSDQGAVKIGVCDLKGESDKIIQISAYLCHPNLMNNELSGPIGQVFLYHLLKAMPKRKYTYRFVINPETIGAICYLSKHAQELKDKLVYGVVLTCIAAPYNTKTQNLGTIEKNIKSIDLDSDYFELVEAIAKSYDHNFLELPLSFKMTRQSSVDEFKFYLEQVHTHQQQLITQTHVNEGSIKAEDLTALLQKAASAEVYSSDKAQEHISYICNAIFDKNISDEHKLALYAQSERAYDIQGCANYNALNCVVPHGSQHKFNYTYAVDNSLAYLANSCKERVSLRRFSPTSGSDERQYCSALLNLPMVQVTRTQYGCYLDYHTSNDNQSVFSLDSIVDSALGIFRCLQYLEQHNDKPCIGVYCEPQLGKRGLYPDINSPKVRAARNNRINSLETLLTLLNMSDGSFSIDELALSAQVSPLDLMELIEHLYNGKVLNLA